MTDAADDTQAPDVQNLWQSQPKELTIMSLDQLHAHAKVFKSKVDRRNAIEFGAAAIVIVAFSAYAIIFDQPMMRLGACLVVGAALLVSLILYLQGRSLPVSEQAEDCVDFHRRALIRQRKLTRTAWLWYVLPFVPGMGLFIYPRLMSESGGTALGRWVVALTIVAVFAGVIIINLMAAHRLQKEIDRLGG